MCLFSGFESNYNWIVIQRFDNVGWTVRCPAFPTVTGPQAQLQVPDDEEYIEKEIEKAGPFTLMFALRPEHITGKRVKEE